MNVRNKVTQLHLVKIIANSYEPLIRYYLSYNHGGLLNLSTKNAMVKGWMIMSDGIKLCSNYYFIFTVAFFAKNYRQLKFR